MEAALFSVLADDIRKFRKFSRMYTKIIGTLEEGLLSTKYTLPQARVLYEIATRDAPQARQIADELGMDPGYLSRILATFRTSGLLKRTISKEDNRAANLALTRAGKRAFAILDRGSEQQAGAILKDRLPSDRARLIQAMETIEGILGRGARSSPAFVLRPHRSGDMGWVVHREAILYAEEYGFDETFEALVAQIVSDFIKNFEPRRERCWIAEIDGTPAGHIFLVRHPDRPGAAKLRLLLVEPAARGKGVGRALVNECIRFARGAGYKVITLWTQSILLAAHRVYENAGFRLVQEERHHSFGQDLVGQTWELDLTQAEAAPR
jgi:DNA-binding MarR family transcriptional regulator/GNAT superfamily N-acetyltransferase